MRNVVDTDIVFLLLLWTANICGSVTMWLAGRSFPLPYKPAELRLPVEYWNALYEIVSLI